jgi:hypothetical protein
MFSQNYWVFGLCPWSGVQKTKECNVSETGHFHPQVRREMPTLMDPLERANFNNWTTQYNSTT